MQTLLLLLRPLVREALLYMRASPQSRRRRRQLEALTALDDHLLRDIGLDRTAARGGRADRGPTTIHEG